MNPVFNDYINYLKHHKIELGLKEGYYWIDNQIIKAFDKNGKIHKIVRLYTNDDLSIDFKYYKLKENVIFETWEETYQRFKENILDIERESIDTINHYIEVYNNSSFVLLTSMGKDSQLVKYLIDKIGLKYIGLFNNTSLDCADTYRMVKKDKLTNIVSPNIGFYKWVIAENNIPSRINRTCCSIFKEGRTVDWLIDNKYKDKDLLMFLGMRNEESNGRSKYGDIWKNNKWDEKWNGILPIRKWKELDVWLYTLHINIEINPKYKKGYARVGCAIACPFYTKSVWALDKYWYRSMYNRWQKILADDFLRNAKWTRMNCTLEEYLKEWSGGSIRDYPTEDVLNEFAEHQNITKDIAIKYFDNYCKCCGRKVLGRDLISVNMKLNGRNSGVFFCKKHLKIQHGITSEKEWRDLLFDFKHSGCSLF